MSDRPGPSGRWTKRRADLHKCSRPGYAESRNSVAVGDQWTCNACETTYTVTGLEHGMQHDPIDPPMIRWDKEVREIDMAKQPDPAPQVDPYWDEQRKQRQRMD